MTSNDDVMLKANPGNAEDVRYGAIFYRSEKENLAFVANLVVLGTEVQPSEYKVQTETGTFADERTLFLNTGKECALGLDPEKWVVEIGAQSKKGLLAGASRSHFENYLTRLKEINELTATMAELQGTLAPKITAVASRSPVFMGGINVENDFDKYLESEKKALESKQER